MKTEVKVGFFVFVSFLVLVASVIYLGRSSMSAEGKVYRVSFNFLNDLKTGAEVKFAGGITVGMVQDIKIEPQENRVILTIWIKKDFPITDNAVFFVLGEGFLGEKYLNVSFEKREEPAKELKENSLIIGKNSVSIGEIFQNIYDLSQKMNETVDSLNFILSGVSKRKDVERIAEKTVKLLNETSKIIEENKENIKQIIQEVIQSSKTLNQLMAKDLPQIMRNTNNSINSITNSALNAAKDLSDLMAVTKNLMIDAQKLIDFIRNSDGILNKILTDKKMPKDLEETIINLRKLSEILLNHPLLLQENRRREGSYYWERK